MSEDKHYLKVKNFGPLKDVEIDLTNKDLIVLIGPQASGKSTIAKLLGIMMDSIGRTDQYYRVYKDPKFALNHFILKTNDYSISKYWSILSQVEFKNSQIEYFELKGDKISTRFSTPGFASTESTLSVLKLQYNEINDFLLNHQRFIIGRSQQEHINHFIENAEYLSNRWIEIIDNKSRIANDEELEFSNKLNQLRALANSTSPINSKDLKKLVHDIYNRLSSLKLNYDTNIKYVSSERNLISLIQQSSFSFLKIARETSLPNHLLELGELYQRARNKNNIFVSPTLGYVVVSDGDNDFIELNRTEKIPLRDAASGIQSLIPLEVIVSSSSITNNLNTVFIIEEPELNLYPTTQKKLVEFLVEKCTQNGNKLIITTHSPYILTALNNHITAHNVAKERPELADEVAQKIPREQWLDFDKVGAYYVDKGTAKNIMDDEHKLINYEQIDDVADELGETFDSLIEMEYRKVN